MNLRWLIALMMLTFLFSSVAEGSIRCSKRDPLFKIERNKNENVVEYDACLLSNNHISESSPVHAYWVLANGKKEELSVIEKKKAYGIKSEEKLGENKYRIVLAALKDRSLVVERMATGYKALTRINGQLSILERVYVQAGEKALGLPSVEHVDLFGRSLKTNQPVEERIIPRS